LPQEGSSFGGRLRHAMAQATLISSGPIVVLGSDTPKISDRHIRQALQAVRSDPAAVVIGPATDGGIYLLASRRPIGEILLDVRWCGSNACADLMRSFAAPGFHVVLLEPLGDLDNRKDLESWLAESHTSRDGWIAIVRRLRGSLALLRWSTPSHRAPASRRPPRLQEGRAPPLAPTTPAP
jgi:glycosyltransferase A (GT-A) superfamily protein (DUF2064 family)